MKNTNYTGDIKKYQFLYPILPDATVLFISMITGTISQIISKSILGDGTSFSASATMLAATVVGGISFVVSIIVMLASAFACAKLLDAAITEDEVKKSKLLRTLAIIITVSTVISAVVYVIRSIVTDDIHMGPMIQNIIGYILTTVLAWAVALVKTDNKKVEIAVYTVLPILAIIF